MYCQHWGLEQSPFRSQLASRFFYESPLCEEALARLHFLVESQRRLGLLVGPAGTGKSLVFAQLAKQLRANAQNVALIDSTGLSGEEFLGELAVQWQVSVPETAPSAHVWQALAERVMECRYERRASVLLVDGADGATSETLLQLIRLAQLDNSPEARLTLAVALRPQRVRRLGDRLIELVELQVTLEPWEEEDSIACVERLLAMAGGRPGTFSRSALAELHSRSHGVPRKLTRLADLALLAGAGEALAQIEPGTIAAVERELA